jgi:hypothetical protein
MYFKNINNVTIDVDGSGNFDRLKNLTAKAKIKNSLIDNAAYYQTVEVIDGERPDHLSQRLYGAPHYHWTFLLLNPQIKNIWDDWPMKYSQLVEYCIEKYQYLAADTDDDLNNKFILGETVTGSVSSAVGILKEIHVNMGYLVIEKTSGTFTITGETVTGLNSSDSIACNFVKSQAYAPHHHTDDSTGEWVPRRAAGTTGFTYIDYESAVTEQNRNLKIIKPHNIKEVARKFITAMGA